MVSILGLLLVFLVLPQPAPAGKERPCEAGEECYQLGQDYSYGDGVVKDDEKAAFYYRLACDLEYARGCYKLGTHYHYGMGLDVDRKKADQFYKKAVEIWTRECKTRPKACTDLGEMQYNGLGVKKDAKAAAVSFKKACDGKDCRGCGLLGDLYELGEGVKQDLSKARHLQEIGCW